MRIEQLEYLQTVARLGSLRRAAEELHISQPALSETVRNLERELGVDLLDRRRSGARASDAGRELLPHVAAVLEAVDRLRRVADHQHQVSRMVRLGTVHAATVPLLVPAVRDFRTVHERTQVEVVTAQQTEIHRMLTEGGLDLGLVNYLSGDDLPPDLESTRLLNGRPVVCVRPDDPLARRPEVSIADLLDQPLIMMRAGFVMHRYVHRLLRGRTPAFSYSTDGAEMGKLMVAEGLGATVLPDFSVIGDPLERGGAITWRPLVEEHTRPADITEVFMVVQRRRSGPYPRAARDLHDTLVERAGLYRRSRREAGGRGE